MALAERDETSDVCTDSKGNPEPDPELRDYENVPLKEDIGEYVKREVLPHVPDAWVDESKTKVGYEINFNRYFYQYTPPRPLDEIESDLKQIEKEIADIYAQGKIRAPVHLRAGREDVLIKIFQDEQIGDEDYVYGYWDSHELALLKGVPSEELKQSILEAFFLRDIKENLLRV